MLTLPRPIALAAGLFLSFELNAAPNEIGELETVRENLSQALEYRDQAAKEQAAWELRQGEMENLLLVAREESATLNSALEAARPILDELQAQKAELLADQAESTELSSLLQSAIPQLSGKLLKSSQRWPEPLLTEASEALIRINSLLSANKATYTDSDLELLVQATVVALETALEFQNSVHHSSILRELPDGREALYDVVFIGLAGGYYLSEDLEQAGRIVAAEGSWQWLPQDELLPRLLDFVAILKKEQAATWVNLPASLPQEGGPQ